MADRKLRVGWQGIFMANEQRKLLFSYESRLLVVLHRALYKLSFETKDRFSRLNKQTCMSIRRAI